MTFSTIIILIDKTKSLFTPWKRGSIRKYKYLFGVWFVVLRRYLFQLIALSKPDSDCLRSFMLSWTDKVTRGIKSLVSFIWNPGLWFAAVPIN